MCGWRDAYAETTISVFTDQEKSSSGSRVRNIKNEFTRLRALSNTGLKVFDVQGLHDRYILIMDKDGKPCEGYTLSNSIQNAAANYPLLVTPIPTGIMPDLWAYTNNILSDNKVELFDSSRLGSPSIQLHGKETKFSEFDNVKDKKIRMIELLEEMKCSNGAVFDRQLSELAYYLSNSSSDYILDQKDLFSKHITNNIIHYLNERSKDSKEVSQLTWSQLASTHQVRYSIAELTQNVFHLDRSNLAYNGRASGLDWIEFFSIKILWEVNQGQLVHWLDLLSCRVEDKTIENARAIYFSQGLSHLVLACILTLKSFPLNLLLQCKTGLLKFIGFCFIENKIHQGSITELKQAMDILEHEDQLDLLGWIARRVVSYKINSELVSYINTKLTGLLNENIEEVDATKLINILSGIKRSPNHNSIGTYQNIIATLIRKNTVDANSLLSVYLTRIIDRWNTENINSFNLVSRQDICETLIFADLFGKCTEDCKRNNMQAIDKEVGRILREIQRPLSPLLNNVKWCNLMSKAIWVDALLRWAFDDCNSNEVQSESFSGIVNKIQKVLEYSTALQKEYLVRNNDLLSIFASQDFNSTWQLLLAGSTCGAE